MSSVAAADTTAIVLGNLPSGDSGHANETKVSALLPCASLGFNLFIY
jgi:hypothetical protein